MTLINVLIGELLSAAIPLSAIFVVATVLFIVFGVKIIYEAHYNTEPPRDV